MRNKNTQLNSMNDTRILNLDEKNALYKDGYVILKKVIPDKILK